jgi:hypothetical protein
MTQELWVIEISTCSCCSFPEYVAAEEEAKRVCDAIPEYRYYEWQPKRVPTVTLVDAQVSEFIDARLYEDTRDKTHWNAKKSFEEKRPYPEPSFDEWKEDFECECFGNPHNYIEQCLWQKDLDTYLESAIALIPKPTNYKERWEE